MVVRQHNSNSERPAPKQNALLVFANPVALDCQRRNWPATFQQLFSTAHFLKVASADTDVHVFTSCFSANLQGFPYTVHCQPVTSTSFGDRLEAAVDTLAAYGYQKIVIVGSDCPALTGDDILQAFSLLDAKRLVVGPDHRGGCYLIGLHTAERGLLAGVRWHRNTDCAELTSRAGLAATVILAVKQDLDSLEDIQLLAHSELHLSVIALSLLLTLFCRAIREFRLSGGPQEKTRPILCWQLPPPELSFS